MIKAVVGGLRTMRVLAFLALILVGCAGEEPKTDVADTDTEPTTNIDTDTEVTTDTDTDTDTTTTDTDTDDDTDTIDTDTDTDGSDTDISLHTSHTGLPTIPNPIDTDTAVVDTSSCPFPGDIPDCVGECYPAIWVGDGICDDGTMYIWGDPDFNCAQFNYDAGDCGFDSGDSAIPDDSGGDTDDTDSDIIPIDTDDCIDPLDILDCDLNCYPVTWIGDGQCDDGTLYPYGDPNFYCLTHDFDAGDCDEDTDSALFSTETGLTDTDDGEDSDAEPADTDTDDDDTDNGADSDTTPDAGDTDSDEVDTDAAAVTPPPPSPAPPPAPPDDDDEVSALSLTP